MAKERILVVDDEEDILELVRFNLAREGYVLVCTTSGEKALEIARKEHPDLLVLDLMLPGIDGLEVAKILKNDVKTKDIPIIMLTAKGEEADMDNGSLLGELHCRVIGTSSPGAHEPLPFSTQIHELLGVDLQFIQCHCCLG